MPTTPPFGIETGVKLNPGQVPAFTAEDMMAHLEGRPSCGLGPTVSGQPPTVESIEFATCRELKDRLHVDIGLPDDALTCFVVLRGPFLLTLMSRPQDLVARRASARLSAKSTTRAQVVCSRTA